MDSNSSDLGFWHSIWVNKIVFLWSFLFALFVLAFAYSLTFITDNKELDIIFSLSILTPFVMFFYYKRPPEKNFYSLDKLISNVALLFMVNTFGIFIFLFLSILAFHPFKTLVNLLSIIFMIQIFTGFFVSVLHGLLPLIKSTKLKNKHFLRLTLTTLVFVSIIFLNSFYIEQNFGSDYSKIMTAIALTLFTTLTVHFIQKNCSNEDDKLLVQSIKVFLIIVAGIIWMTFIDKDKTQQSIDTLLTLSTSFLLPVAFSFLFSSVLVIVDKQIAQSEFVFSSHIKDARIIIINALEIPIFIVHKALLKLLSIPLK